ncbi:hypothetical protein NC651_005735 [Populus alba x Populus x berolinensis]|nr:hypothetical protein NC651_005735 [Populus alba x Populus x berolinensis]
MPNSRSCYWMWMEVEDGLWVLFGLNGVKRSNELLVQVQEKMGRDGDKYHSIQFLRTKENKRCAPCTGNHLHRRQATIHHLGL